MESNKSGNLTFKMSFNDETILKLNRKKNKRTMICSFIGFFFMVGVMILSLVSNNSETVVSVLFGVLAVFCLVYALVMINSTKSKASQKNDNLYFKYTFYSNGLQVSKNSRKNPDMFKDIVVCLYRASKNKKYIAKVIEEKDAFTFKVLTGTTDLIPVYQEYPLSKSVFNDDEQLENFIKSLKGIFTKDYIIK